MKSEFDPSKDKCLTIIGTVDLGDKVRAEVSVRQYADGPAKIACQKVGKKANGTEWFSNSVGRLTAEEGTKVSLLMVTAAQYIVDLTKPAKVEPARSGTKVIRRPAKKAPSAAVATV